MSGEIKEKINILEQRHRFMTDTWEKRKVLYDQNLDTQVFMTYNCKRDLTYNLETIDDNDHF